MLDDVNPQEIAPKLFFAAMVNSGQVQNRMQFEKVQPIIEDARQHGQVLAGGKPHQGKGFFIHPTVVSGLPDSARLACEEQFGPVMPVLKYSSIDEVITRANASEYGLGATVWVNKHLDLPPSVPYGGTKQSGYGVEMGQLGLEEFTQMWIVNIALQWAYCTRIR